MENNQYNFDYITPIWFFTRQSLARPLTQEENVYSGLEFKPNTGLHLWPAFTETMVHKGLSWQTKEGKKCFLQQFKLSFVYPNFVKNLLSLPKNLRKGMEIPDLAFIYQRESDYVLIYSQDNPLKYNMENELLVGEVLGDYPIEYIDLGGRKPMELTIETPSGLKITN